MVFHFSSLVLKICFAIAIAKQILSTNDEKWNTIPKAYNELDNLRAKYEEENDTERLAMMNDLNNFLEEIEKKYQDA